MPPSILDFGSFRPHFVLDIEHFMYLNHKQIYIFLVFDVLFWLSVILPCALLDEMLLLHMS